MALALKQMRIFYRRKSVLSAKLVRYLTELCPRPFGYLSLIMFSLKSLACVEVHIVYDDVIMDMVMVCMKAKHILILVIEKSLAKFLTYQQSSFGTNFPRGKALNYVLSGISASSCADCLSDISELF